jgi:hypothetical protein
MSNFWAFFQLHPVSDDVEDLVMKLFLATLLDASRHWYYSLPDGSIKTMDKLEEAFLKRWSIKEDPNMLLTGYHAKVVALGCMAKRKGVSSQANLLICVKVLVGNIATTGHHARAMSPDKLLERKSNKEIRIKGMNWAWKHLHPRQVQLAFYKRTHR